MLRIPPLLLPFLLLLHAGRANANTEESDLGADLDALIGTHRATASSWRASVESWAGAAYGDASTGLRLETEGQAAYEYGRRFSSYIAAGAALESRKEDGRAPFELEQWASLRPYEIGVFRIDFDHRLTMNRRPGLSQRPDSWREESTIEELDFDVTGAHWLWTHFGFEFLRIREGFDLEWSGPQGRERFATSSDWTMGALQYDPGKGRAIAQLDLMSLEGEAVDAERQAAVATTMYVRIRNLPVGPLPLRLSGAYGDAGISQVRLSSGDHTKVIVTEDLPNLQGVPVWRASLEAELLGASLGLRAHRSLFLTADTHLALEERAEVTAELPLRSTYISAEAFAANTAIWNDSNVLARRDVRTGGGAAAIERDWRDHWRIFARAELARSFYAELDGAVPGQVSDALRVELGLKLSTGKSPLTHGW